MNVTVSGNGSTVEINVDGQQYSDPLGDGTVNVYVNPASDINRFVFAVVHGQEQDLVYGYAIVGGHCFRSQQWRDKTPGPLNLTGVTWAGLYQLSIVNRGTMSFDGNTTWTYSNVSGAVIDSNPATLF